jgi:nucleoside-diphosphate-sugar epimerase
MSAKMKKDKAPTLHQESSSSHLPSALVAGAAGFLGSHLCEVLLLQNCRVYGIDDWTTGKKKNIKNLLKNPNFVFIEHDLNKTFKSPVPKLDYIFHLAGVEAYINGLDVSLETLLVNSLGTRELLDIAKEQSAKFLLASTIDIHQGFLSNTDLDNYFGSQKPKAEAYSHHEAKRFSEALTFEYVNRYQLDARIVRVGHVFGPRMDLKAGGQLAKLLIAAQNDQNLMITGQGLTPLYPTYISDLIYGLTKAMFSQSSTSHIYTLVNPEKTTVLNLAYKLKSLLPEKNLKLKFVESEEEPGSTTITDEIIKSQQNLGWTPKVSLDEAIVNTLKSLDTGGTTLPKSLEPSTKVVAGSDTYSSQDLGINPAPPTIKLKNSPTTKLLLETSNPLKLLGKINLPKSKKISLPKFNLKKTFKLRKPSKFTLKAKLIAISLSLLVLYLVIPIIAMAGFAYSGVNSLKKASQITDFSQINSLVSLTDSAQKNLNQSRKLLRYSQPTFRLVGLKSLAQNLDRLLYIGSKLSQGASHLAQAGDSGTLLTGIIFHHDEGNLTEALKRIQINLDQAYSELSFVESELQSGQELELDLTASLAQKFQSLTGDLPVYRQKINQVRSILPLVPSFIAEDSKKTYLLLFQNSAELRPTGGFIGSYGLLTFEKGKLLDFNVEDIYSADGQLKGYVEPPEPIKEFLGQNTWYFRDSNWDPDFPVSAQRAEWFLQKTTNRSVDGVIAINLPAVKELLKASGTINLSDYNEQVTADNLFERAEYHSEIDFFPGSTQKKDFLGALTREIYSKIENSSASDLLKFVKSFETSLAQKQILLYFHDPESQKLLLEQNWAGSIFSPTLTNPDNHPNTNDYSYFVDANLGINKANYFLKRKLQHQLSILKNKEVLVVSTLTFNNQSPADAWPGGIYRSYLRDYLPIDSTLISVKVGDDKLDIDTQVDRTTANEKAVIGFPVTVPVKNSVDVIITYRLAKPLELTQNQGRLNMIIPKQPGIVNDLIEVIVNYPSYLTVASVYPQALSSPQVVTFQSDMTTDRIFTVDFIER